MNQRLKRFCLKNSERISKNFLKIFCFKKEQSLIPIQIKMIRKELVNFSFLFRLTLFEAEYIIVKKGSEK
jgi:hypothetical protein